MFKYLALILLTTAGTKSCNNEKNKTTQNSNPSVVEQKSDKMENSNIHDIYVLEEIDGMAFDKALYPNGVPNLEINITENKIMGFSGCNNFFGNIDSIFGNSIKLGPIAATKKYCQGVDENSFFDKLNNVNQFKREGLKLFLYNKDELLLIFKKVD